MDSSIVSIWFSSLSVFLRFASLEIMLPGSINSTVVSQFRLSVELESSAAIISGGWSLFLPRMFRTSQPLDFKISRTKSKFISFSPFRPRFLRPGYFDSFNSRAWSSIIALVSERPKVTKVFESSSAKSWTSGGCKYFTFWESFVLTPSSWRLLSASFNRHTRIDDLAKGLSLPKSSAARTPSCLSTGLTFQTV